MIKIEPIQPDVFYSPCKIVFGLNTAGSVAEEIRQLGGGKILIVTDPGIVKAQVLAPIETALRSDGIPYALYDGVQPEPPSEVIDRGAEFYRAEGCRLVVGVGGGSSLDAAKGISILAGNPGGILDYTGLDRVPRRGAPLVLMPTTAGTGSEVTRVLVVTDERENLKSVVFSRFAVADTAIIDPLLTVGMPPHVTADTGMDAFVHAAETYVSMNATVFSDLHAERAIERIARWLPAACAKSSNIEARYHLSAAATLAGLAFGSGGLGAVHALAYPLGTEYHMTHGRTNALMLPHVMRYNLAGAASKYGRMAALMGRDVAGRSPLAAAGQCVEAVKELLQAIGVSFRMSDYGIPRTDLPKLVQGAMKQARLFVPNPRDLCGDDVRLIYEEAC
ncbi:MAG: iron-containing alcohol dehydrogenase [Desulfobacterales bacterium]|jgi:alcohol dehydrogenase class IV|nr:iron-containing alcohol dehydrogenase [Desulfobacterales bacterium]